MKKIIILIAIILIAVISLTACNGTEPSTQNEENTATTLELNKSLALSTLDATVDLDDNGFEDEDIKAAILRFYNEEKAYIESIVDEEVAKAAVKKIAEDVKAFAKNTLKPFVINKLNGAVESLIEKIPQEDIQTLVSSFYVNEKDKLSSIESIDALKSVYNEIIDDIQSFISEESGKVLIALKNAALEELDPYVTALIGKIPFDSLKTDTLSFYNEEKEKLAAVNNSDQIAPCINEIKEDMEEYIFVETKEMAVSELAALIETGLSKIPNQKLKDDLAVFADQELARINALEDIESVSDTISTVLSETQAYIKELLASTVKEYLSRLTAIENATAYDYLPAAMCPNYNANIVTSSSIDYDFSGFTNVSSLNRAGFGDQWQMVVENIEQTRAMAKVFNVAQTTLSIVGSAVDSYITNLYSEEMEYIFENSKYSGEFSFNNSVMTFKISLVELIDLPAFGSVQPEIQMEYDLAKEKKTIFISIGDAYKVKYTVSDHLYEMVSQYGITIEGKNVSRSSYLSIEKTEQEKVVGHIYEYTTYENSDLIKACADFYVENGYVSVIGNKSGGMIGFDGYINELYLANSGRLLGYEVRETKTIAKTTKTYDTLWFNLWDVQGINSIKVTEKTDDNQSGRSTVDVYCNGSSTLFTPTYNTLIIKTSRKYDIELRNRYYYTYDQEADAYVANKVEIPMLFIQEGANYDSFSSDIQKDNGISASVALNQTYLNKIMDDYDTLIDVFIENKDMVSSATIASYLE